MLSVVVVGRNDSHGYNLSKRVATSLNSISLPMSGDDELIFVDWNSDDINPTFIDAIKDTLTDKTLRHLVVYRVRSNLHQKLNKGTNRPILEPIARNVGIRRAKNEWVLSTNTDMIFDTFGKTYSDLLTNLEPNLYHVFRYEIPEYVWDQFDRKNPASTIHKVRQIFGYKDYKSKILTQPYDGYPNLFPDAVGDFQLTTKRIWESVKGFPEDMLKGWHVDSRLSVQIETKNNFKSKILDSKLIEGYHQNHLRVLTHFHASTAINSLEIIQTPYSNPETWGLSDFEMESELEKNFSIRQCQNDNESLNLKSPSEIVLQDLLQSPLYNPYLVGTFLLDDLVNLPPGSKVLISSIDADFERNIHKISNVIFGKDLELDFIRAESKLSLKAIDFYILDFGIPQQIFEIQSREITVNKLEKIIKNNISLLEKIPTNSRVTTIRAQHWTLRGLIHEYCSVPLFNNYSGLLSGRVKHRNHISKFKAVRKLRNLLRQEMYLSTASISLNKSNEYYLRNNDKNLVLVVNLKEHGSLLTLTYKCYKKMPFRIRNYINPKIRKFFKII